jgi:hypothetical protein
MSTALIITCTGDYCQLFLRDLIREAHEYFPADILLFTDAALRYDVKRQVYVPHLGWPQVMLMRYGLITSEADWLRRYDQTFYLDVDMSIRRPIGSEIFSDGITATAHHCFPTGGPFESNPASTAYVSPECQRQYFVGAFWGGKTSAVLEMARVCHKYTLTDMSRQRTALWYDESYLNRYMAEYPPAKVLSTSYCTDYRDDGHIVSLPKDTDVYHKP